MSFERLRLRSDEVGIDTVDKKAVAVHLDSPERCVKQVVLLHIIEKAFEKRM